jgi:hypothetical protein
MYVPWSIINIWNHSEMVAIIFRQSIIYPEFYNSIAYVGKDVIL